MRLDTAWDGVPFGPTYVSSSSRGYTSHEHLDEVGLIHMNGRVYDPELARFLSPDLFIQAPTNTQSYNRYSYVMNNPLSFTDPSGYICVGPDSSWDNFVSSGIDFASSWNTSVSQEMEGQSKQMKAWKDAAAINKVNDWLEKNKISLETALLMLKKSVADKVESETVVGLDAQKGDGFFKGLWKKATGWHFEGRDARNGNLPTYEQATGQGSEWTLLSPEQSIFHDNGVGKPELKFIHPDGREAVFNGDTLSLVTDPKYVGTYNYVNPAPVPDRWYDVGGWGAYAGKGLGHLVLDVVPYAAGGNVRGEN